MYDMKASFIPFFFWFRFVDLYFIITGARSLCNRIIFPHGHSWFCFYVFMFFLSFSFILFLFGLVLSFVSVPVSSHRTSQTRLDHCHRVYGVWHDRTLDLFLFIKMCVDGRLWRTTVLCARFDLRRSMGTGSDEGGKEPFN